MKWHDEGHHGYWHKTLAAIKPSKEKMKCKLRYLPRDARLWLLEVDLSGAAGKSKILYFLGSFQYESMKIMTTWITVRSLRYRAIFKCNLLVL
jgi:hypothetical protein